MMYPYIVLLNLTLGPSRPCMLGMLFDTSVYGVFMDIIIKNRCRRLYLAHASGSRKVKILKMKNYIRATKKYLAERKRARVKIGESAVIRYDKKLELLSTTRTHGLLV